MNKYKTLIFVAGLFTQIPVFAQAVIDGTFDGNWEGVLNFDANTSMTLSFASNLEDDNRVVRLSSPDNGAITNIRASSVEANENGVSLEFPSLDGSFEGQWENQDRLVGEWNQAGTSFPLVLAKLAERTISTQDLARIIGDWSGTFSTPFGDRPWAVRFETTENGSLQGIGLGQNGEPGGPPMSEINLIDSKLRFVLQGFIYEGSLTSETAIEGELTRRNGVVMPMNLSKK